MTQVYEQPPACVLRLDPQYQSIVDLIYEAKHTSHYASVRSTAENVSRGIIRSALDHERRIIVLAYNRKLPNITKSGRHIAATILIIKARLSGLTELDTTPVNGPLTGRVPKPVESAIS